MMSHMSAANTEQEKDDGRVVISPSVFDGDTIVIPSPPAPPPPLPVGHIQRRRRIRSFYWKPIPEDCIQQRGSLNLWTLAKDSDKYKFHIDIRAIEDLFGHNEKYTVTTASKKTSRVYSSLPEQNKEISILDPKRSMNVAIFLKCFKKSIQSVIDDIVQGNSEKFGAERLRELNKLLPDTHEIEKLHSYNGDKTQLNTVDYFMYHLTLLPRFDLHVEAMLLKEEFSTLCSSLKQDMFIIRSAIRELLSCEELHSVLHLVLEAGNILNTGGYGGNAVGFNLSSLLSLAEIKSNKPGMNLLNFVALEAQKTDDQLLKFPEKLQHVESAARVSVDSMDVELENLNKRIKNLQQNVQNDTQLLQQLHAFLQCAAVSLKEANVCHALLMTEGDEMIDFFCEDRETFKLEECFYIFYHFCSKFTKAVQENVECAMRAESQLKRMKVGEEKRPSWGGQHWVGGVLGARCSSEIDVRAAVKWEGLIELLNAKPPNFHNSLGGFGLHRPRQRLSGSNISITDTHSPSDSHSNSANMCAQVETRAPIPELQDFPFKTLFHGHHEDDPTEISSSNVINDEKFPHHGTDIKQLDKNRHSVMTSDPAQAKSEVDAKLVLEVESEVGLGVEPDVGLREEPELVLVADSEVGLGSESDVILGVESDMGRTLDLLNKHCETQNKKGNSNMLPKHKLIFRPATAETSTTASISNPSNLKTTGNSTDSTKLEIDCKSTHQFLASKEGEKKRIQSAHLKNSTLPNNARSKSVNSFSNMSLKKSIVSPEPSASLSSQRLRPLHPVQTLTHTEKQSMRKVISVISTKPRPITHSHSLKVFPSTTYASSGTATSAHMRSTPKMSSIQKSLVRKPMIQQKSVPEEKMCRSTLHTLDMPTQESRIHTQKNTPRFAYSTVASTTRSAVTTGNAPLTQKDVSTAPKMYSPNRTVLRRVSGPSLPSGTGSIHLPLPCDNIKKIKVKSVRPAWR